MAPPSAGRPNGAVKLTREERFYEAAGREVAAGAPIPAIWGKALSLAEGDEQKARASYIHLRVEQLDREATAEWVRLEAPRAVGGETVTCPSCEEPTNAVVKVVNFARLRRLPDYRYFCRHCSAELVRVWNDDGKITFGKPPCADGKADAQAAANNPMALTGLILGLISVPFYAIGILPVLAVVFGAIGLARFDPARQKNKWMAGVGLALGLVFTLVMLAHYGHLR